jgi:hypothetical protein
MSGLRVWASVRDHARVLAMPVSFLMSPVCNRRARATASDALVRAVRLLGGGRRLRARRPHRRQLAREVPMLTPKVTELTRGSAHPRATGPAKASAISGQGG